MKAISEWTTEEILQWIYIIGERSDRVISYAQYSEDWTAYNEDEQLYADLGEELVRRGLDHEGKPYVTLVSVRHNLSQSVKELNRSIIEALPKWLRKLLRFDTDNPSSVGE